MIELVDSQSPLCCTAASIASPPVILLWDFIFVNDLFLHIKDLGKNNTKLFFPFTPTLVGDFARLCSDQRRDGDATQRENNDKFTSSAAN